MSYQVDVEFFPIYELVISLQAFVHQPNHKTLDVGIDWVRNVKSRLQPELAKQLSSSTARKNVRDGFIDVLLVQSPNKQEVEGFLQWISSLSPGDMYELLVIAGVDPAGENLGNLEERRDAWVGVLRGWNEGYFSQLDGAIIQGLHEEADRLCELRAHLSSNELVRTATHGLHVNEDTQVERVLLIPQYHYRPWNVTSQLGSLVIDFYPADFLPLAVGEPPKSLTRLVKALGDESRLRILRYIAAEGPSAFTDIVQFSGLAKGTVHHHLVALRAAGLVWLFTDMGENRKYQVDEKTIDDISNLVKGFVFGP